EFAAKTTVRFALAAASTSGLDGHRLQRFAGSLLSRETRAASRDREEAEDCVAKRRNDQCGYVIAVLRDKPDKRRDGRATDDREAEEPGRCLFGGSRSLQGDRKDHREHDRVE